MKVTVNGEARDIAEHATIQALLETMGADARYLAVAVNMEFIPRSEYPATALQEGDEVEIVSPQAGG